MAAKQDFSPRTIFAIHRAFGSTYQRLHFGDKISPGFVFRGPNNHSKMFNIFDTASNKKCNPHSRFVSVTLKIGL